MTLVVGADGGNKNVKMYGDKGEMMFNSELGEYRERKLEQVFSDNDIIFEYKDRKGFAGTLAEYESQFCTSMMGDTKAHEEFLIRILIGLHRYSDTTTDFKIVVGQPISKHTVSEKMKMKKMLEGEHEITVNNQKKVINIIQAEVAAEGGSAFWSAPTKGKVRILDFGSGTVNCATLNDARYIDKDSFTIREGMNTLLTDDVAGLVREVSVKALRRWDVDDRVLVCGGGAETVVDLLKQYFTDVSILRPKIQVKSENGSGASLKMISSVYANAVGYYNIGKKIFSDSEVSKV